MLDKVAFSRLRGVFMHPDHHGFKFVADVRNIIYGHEHVSAGDIDFIFQCHRNCLRRKGLFDFPVGAVNRLDFRFLARGQTGDRIALANYAGSQRSAEAPEIQIRAQDILHRQAHIDQVAVGGNIDAFHMVQEGRTVIPREVFTVRDNIVALERRHRNKVDIGKVQSGNEPVVVLLDLVVDLFGPIDQIHFVDGYHDVLDPEQRADEAVPLGLGNHAVAGVDQNDRQVTGGCPGSHVAGVLLVAGAVGDNELALVGREIAVRDVDGDSLFAFGFQTVRQKGWIEILSGRAVYLGILGDLFQLIFVDHMGVIKQSTDQRRFPVIHGTTGQQTKQILGFVPVEIFADIRTNQLFFLNFIGGVTHCSRSV